MTRRVCTCAGTAPGYPQHESFCGKPETEEAMICEHVDMPDTALQVVSLRPRGALPVRCPCCGLCGWMTPSDEPMTCPYCAVNAVNVGGEAS